MQRLTIFTTQCDGPGHSFLKAEPGFLVLWTVARLLRISSAVH